MLMHNERAERERERERENEKERAVFIPEGTSS
jgi:hypothetical protein